MRKFIVHAGFHKTATTTVQKTLEQHSALLAPHVELIHRKALKPVRNAAQVFSGNYASVDLALFEMRLYELLLTLDLDDNRPVLISSEDFSGYIIGRHGVSSYVAAIPILECLKSTLKTIIGEAPNLTIYFSTRRNGWLESCHGQPASNEASTLSETEFVERFTKASEFDAIIGQVRECLAPAQVTAMEIEDLTGRLGPLQPLLDLAEIPENTQSQVTPLPPQNVRAPSLPRV